MHKNDFYHKVGTDFYKQLGVDNSSRIREYIGRNLADRPKGLLAMAISSYVSDIYPEFN